MNTAKKIWLTVWIIATILLIMTAISLGIFFYRNPVKGLSDLEVTEENPELIIPIEGKYQLESLLAHNRYEVIDGVLYGYGDNDCGQLGVPISEDERTGKTRYVTSPVQIAEEVKYATAGMNTVLMLMEDGSVYVLGDNKNGQLGPALDEREYLGDKSEMIISYSYEPVLIMKDAVYVESGLYTLAAINDEGDLYMWGDNSFGEIGNGNRGEGLPTISIYYVSEPYLVKENIKDVRIDEFTVYATNYWDEVFAWGEQV